MVMFVQRNDILYNDLPTWNFKKQIEIYNDKKENENVLLKWKSAASLVNQNNELLSMKTKLLLLPTKHKRNYAQGNSKIATK